jgi:hypothetical protein
VSLDAMTQKVREGGGIVNVAVVIAVGVNVEGHREVLGFDIITNEDGAGWLAFLRGLVARGLAGTTLVISDAHVGLVDAVRSTLTGAVWHRCRTHFMRNLLTRVPKSAQAMVATWTTSSHPLPAPLFSSPTPPPSRWPASGSPPPATPKPSARPIRRQRNGTAPHPQADDSGTEPKPVPTTSRATKIFVAVVIALVAALVILHLTGIVGPGTN